MYSINVPITTSVEFDRRYGHNNNEYVIAEADYDPALGLLTEM
jgi:hypothetical protein